MKPFSSIPAVVLLLSALALALLPDDAEGAAPQLAETALKMHVSFEADVSQRHFNEWKDRMAAASELLFKLTEGQLHIAECLIDDKSSLGDFIVLKGLEDESVIPERDAMACVMLMGSPAWFAYSAGRIDGQPGMLWALGTVVVHEMGHGVFGRPDERDPGRENAHCIMGTNPFELCDECKKRISELYGGKVVFPNKAYNEKARPPKTRFTIIDRKQKDPSPEMVPLDRKETAAVDGLRAAGRAFDLTVAFQGNAGEKHFTRWKRNVLLMDRALRCLTGGQFMIRTCRIADKRAEGDIVIEAGAEDASVLVSDSNSMWSRTAKGWLTAGDIPAEGLARYLFAERLKVSERNRECASFLNLGYWGRQIPLRLCDSSNHLGGGESATDQFLREWKSKGVIDPAEAAKKAHKLPCTRFVFEDAK